MLLKPTYAAVAAVVTSSTQGASSRCQWRRGSSSRTGTALRRSAAQSAAPSALAVTAATATSSPSAFSAASATIHRKSVAPSAGGPPGLKAMPYPSARFLAYRKRM